MFCEFWTYSKKVELAHLFDFGGNKVSATDLLWNSKK